MKRPHRTLRSRPRFYGALGLILLLGVTITGVGAIVAGTWRDVLVNLGASVITVFLAALVLEPIIERGRRLEEVIHPDFPHPRFIAGVSAASHQVRIMGAWPYVMDEQWRESFLMALRRALDRGVTVQILVPDPTSKAAEQRSIDLDRRLQVSNVIADVLEAFLAFSRTIESNDSVSRLSIRVYNSLPPARLYQWDNRAISSFFPAGTSLGTEVRHYETNVTSSLGRFVDEQFDTVWTDPDTKDIHEYLLITLKLIATNRQYALRYVVLDDFPYVSSTDMTDDLHRNAGGQNEVEIVQEHSPQGKHRARSFILQTVPDNHPSASAICDLFERKYGDRTLLPDSMKGVHRLIKRGGKGHG